jgi:hypothetical protein
MTFLVFIAVGNDDLGTRFGCFTQPR